MKDKVAVIDPSCFTPQYDSCLLQAFNEIEHEFDIVYFSSRIDENHVQLFNNVSVIEWFYFLSSRLASYIKKREIIRLFKGVEHFFNSIGLVFYLFAKKYKVVHFQWSVIPGIDRWTISILKLSGMKVVFTVHNALPHDTGEREVNQYRSLYHLVDALFVHTVKTQDFLSQEMCVDSTKIIRIKHGNFLFLNEFDKTQQKYEPSRKQIKEFAGNFNITLVMFGLMKSYKGVDCLVDSLDYYYKTDSGAKSIGILLLGSFQSPSYKKSILDKIAEYGLESNFHIIDRYIEEEEVAQYTQLVDYAVFPYKKIDQSGAAIAMASLGVPLIVSSHPGLLEIVEDNATGFVIEWPVSVKSVSNVLSRISAVSEPQLINISQKLVKKMKTEFSWVDTANTTLQSYLCSANISSNQ